MSGYMFRFFGVMLFIILIASVSVSAEPLGDNISGTPDMASSKAKMNTMTIYVPTQNAAGEATPDPDKPLVTKPIVITYTDEIPATGASDVFAAVSRDDGETWNITNLSNSAALSSFTLADGITPYPGDCRKPVMVAKGNKLFVAWSSKYAPGLQADYSSDLFGVMGEQKSIDYTYAYKGTFAWAGEIPYSAVWTARGSIDTTTGAINWQPAQQLTSGIRDALQIFAGGAGKVGLAISWQEDPEGLLPGACEGPGHGWSGAIANHKTDIWYSYIPWSQFDNPTNFLQSPVRISDNDMCRPHISTESSVTETLEELYDAKLNKISKDPEELLAYCEDLVVAAGVDGLDITEKEEYDATHQYCIDACYSTTFILNDQGEMNEVCVTEDGQVLDGRRAGTRPNIFLQPYTDAAGKPQAWVILGYEETKGFIEPGVFDEGKTIIYHSFDMRYPETISGGTIVNLNEVDGEGNVTDLYENARRIRFIVQPAGKMGDARVPMVTIYKQGHLGTGQPSDIFLRRFVVPEGYDPAVDNPYSADNLQPDALNMSSFTPGGYYVDEEHPEDGVKVTEGIIQTGANLYDQSYANMFSESRAHRGQIRGDKITLGYAQTLNWVASNNGRDKYDFFVRRSFDGGLTWTDAAGIFEPAKNVSNLPDNTRTVIEPRVVATPSSIVCLNDDGVTYSPCTPEDKQSTDTYMVTYGTEINDIENGGPADLFYARTTDFGETYELVSDGYSDPAFDVLAAGDSEQGEVQIRLTPDGSKFYSSWLGEMAISGVPDPTGEEGSDIRFSRIDYVQDELQ